MGWENTINCHSPKLRRIQSGNQKVEQTLAAEPQQEGRVGKAVANKSLIDIVEEKLEINSILEFEINGHSAVSRYAQIATSEPVKNLRSTVYVQKIGNNNATVSVQIQLAYQPKAEKNNKTYLTLVSNRLIDQGGGLKLSARVHACENSDCSLFAETSVADNQSYRNNSDVTIMEVHKLSLDWDEDNAQFLFSFDEATGSVNMKPYIQERKFDIREFKYARLSADIENVLAENESGWITVRFGDVFVNGELYDNFSAEILNLNKWITGETYR